MPSARYAFIVGSPRSGTTILGNILESHTDVGHLYEPYYIWYYHAKDLSTDYIDPADVGPKELDWIRRQFRQFAARTGASLVVDKSPDHCFNVPIVQAAFPEAKFVHILRDGRDAVLSIKKEWQKRGRLVANRNLRAMAKTTAEMLARQPLYYFRAMAVWYELRTRLKSAQTIFRNPSSFFNKAKWGGYAGWGPRFHGWQEVLSEESLISFHAYQWLRCVEQLQADLARIPPDNVYEVRYEDLVSARHRETIERLAAFLGLSCSSDFFSRLPPLKLGNSKKWSHELTEREILDIGPILTPKLRELGYAEGDDWYRSSIETEGV